MIIPVLCIIAFLAAAFILYRIHGLSVANSNLKKRLSCVDNRLHNHIASYNKRIRYQDNPELKAEDKRLAELQFNMMRGASDEDMVWSNNPELLRNSDEAKRYNEIVKNI